MSEPHATNSVGVLTPSGMLGAGITAEAMERGIALGADVITIDGGSTDSGPYYLGASKPKTSAAAVRHDLRIALRAAASAGIPLLIGSCGTSGTDDGVDWVAGMAEEILQEEGLVLKIARIYSEQSASSLKEALNAGRIHPLPPQGELAAETLESCSHIVGVMGAQPFIDALEAGADVVLGGRATDTAVAAALPIMRGLPAGPSWHAAKIVECGGQCTTNPRSGGVFARIDDDGFEIEPLDLDTACTPISVAAHMLYETTNPYTMREPTGTLDVRDAEYTAVDDRRVRVEGSRFHDEPQWTIKLEGARMTGYETMSFVGIRDPHVVARIDEWAEFMRTVLDSRIETTLGLAPHEFAYDLRLYGHNAVLGSKETEVSSTHEVGVMLLINAPDQATATAIAKVANPLMLHLPLPDMAYLPSFAFPTSPAEVERGPAYEFVLNHVVDVDDSTSMFRTEFSEGPR